MTRLRHLLLSFILLTVSGFADPKDPYSHAITEGEPDSLIAGMVSAITGDIHQQQGHMEGKPHVDIRRRGPYREKKYILKNGE